jgi:hypothetical protein
MIFKDIVTKKTYLKDGEEKVVWMKIGTFKETDEGKQFVEINMFPDISYYVFERKPNKPSLIDTGTPTVDESVGEIPF